MPHIDPLPLDAVPEFSQRFEHYRKTRGFVPNSIRTMARRPAIASAFMDLNQAVLYQGTVAEELKMLVSLIASQAAGCRYCQAHMANLSRIYHSSEAKITAIWDYQSSALFSDAERSALNLAYKASLVPNESEAADFAELRKHFSEDEIVEIVAAIALFGYLNRWNDTMATELENHPRQLAEAVIGKVGWQPGKHAG